MNNINEIKTQYQFDFFIKMYTFTANRLLESCGNAGERAVRNALQKYGAELGESLRRQHLEQGIRTNLASLMASENCCGEDPRFFRHTLKATEQVQLWEVYGCPLARLWKQMGADRAGMFYCEECVHSIVLAYTQGKGQANLGERLTSERDSRCSFALYYRPANLDDEQREQSFSSENSPLPSRQYVISDHFIKLYSRLFEEAGSQLGTAGINAIAAGLRDLAANAADSMSIESRHTDLAPDLSFLDSFFPIHMDADQDPLWEILGADNARRLLEINLIHPLKLAMNL